MRTNPASSPVPWVDSPDQPLSTRSKSRAWLLSATFTQPVSTHLVACTQCHRHVRAGDATCPFCRHGVRATPEPRAPVERLSRGGLYAFSVGAMTVATACSSSTTPMVIPPYGGAVFESGYTVGEACTGKGYVVGSEGYLVCYDGQWTYTAVDPADAGYTLVADGDAGDDATGDSGDDATDDGGLTDATTDAHD